MSSREFDRCADIIVVVRYDHREWRRLINTGVGTVQRPGHRIGGNEAAHLAAKLI